MGQLVLGAFGQVHAALCHAQPRQAAARTRALVHGQQHGFGFVRQQLGVRQRAGGDHAHHLAFHRAFGRAHFAHLLGNSDGFTHLDEAGQVVYKRMEGHPRHHHRLPARLAALGQGDVEQPRGFLGVLPEHLVKVTHAVKEQRVRVRGFQAKVLLHHGRVV